MSHLIRYRERTHRYTIYIHYLSVRFVTARVRLIIEHTEGAIPARGVPRVNQHSILQCDDG